MGIVNYYAQKAYIDDVQGDLERMNSYGSFLMQFKSILDDAWAGNIDKQAVMNALNSHLKAVNQVRQDMNWFKVTARFTLDRINELGSLQGAPAPYIPGIGVIGGLIAAMSVNRIRIDTGKIRNVTQLLQGKRGLLEESRNRMYRATNIIDSVILWLFGINGRLVSIQRQLDALVSENTRIVNAIGRICDIYDETDRNLRNKGDSVHITGLINGAGTAPGIKTLLDRLIAVAPTLLPLLEKLQREYTSVNPPSSNPGKIQEKSPNEAAFEDTEDFTRQAGQDITYYESQVGQTIANIRDANGNYTEWYGSPGNLSAKGGYIGQCTWYAYGRFYEKTGIQLKSALHAKYWLDENRGDGRVTVMDGINNIVENSIAVRTTGTYGHVMFIEQVERDANGNPVAVYFTESNVDNNGTYNPGVDCILKKLSWEEFKSQKNPAGYITAK